MELFGSGLSGRPSAPPMMGSTEGMAVTNPETAMPVTKQPSNQSQSFEPVHRPFSPSNRTMHCPKPPH